METSGDGAAFNAAPNDSSRARVVIRKGFERLAR